MRLAYASPHDGGERAGGGFPFVIASRADRQRPRTSPHGLICLSSNARATAEQGALRYADSEIAKPGAHRVVDSLKALLPPSGTQTIAVVVESHGIEGYQGHHRKFIAQPSHRSPSVP